MSKCTKTWLIIASSLVLIGCVIFGGVMTMLKWDFTKLSTVKYETNNHKILEDCKNISIVADTADILFVPCESSESSVVCYEHINAKHSVTEKNGTLVIEIENTRKWYEHIGINFGTPKITIYIPEGKYGTLSIKSDTGDVEIPKDYEFENIDISQSTGKVTNYASASESVKIKTSTGDIRVENISAGSVDLSVSTGSVTALHIDCQGDFEINVSTGKTSMTDTRCKSLISGGSTGDISLKNVIATDKFSIERSTGDVHLEGCDAGEIIITTDTGDIRGTLLSEKIFIAKTDTGKVRVPKTTTGGSCEINTDTGDITISVTP